MRRSHLFHNLCRLASLAFLALLGSGVFLFFAYRPDAADAWGDLYELDGSYTLAATARTFHRAVGILLTLLVVLTVAVGLGQRDSIPERSRLQHLGRPDDKNRLSHQTQTHGSSESTSGLTSATTVAPWTPVGRAVMAILPVFVLIALFSGFLLPWDHLALHAVTVDTSMHGYQAVFSDEVRFVLADGQVLGKGTVARTLSLHAAAAAVIGGWLLKRRPRRGLHKSVISAEVDGHSVSPKPPESNVVNA